jgi:fumarate reductase subunit D
MTHETHKIARLHALLWGVFSLGGMIAAFLLPVTIYLMAIAYPYNLWPFNNGQDAGFLVTGHLLGALFIFVTIGGTLYHGVFRFQSVLLEVGLQKYRRTLEAVGYFVIFAGIIILAYFLGTWFFTGKIA